MIAAPTVAKKLRKNFRQKDISTNIAEATCKNPNGEDVETGGEETVTTVDKNGHLTVTKTSDAEEKQEAALGQIINYTITVINDGNLTITDIRVTDDLTGDEWTIDTLAPGESRDFEAQYEVKEEDRLSGIVTNSSSRLWHYSIWL